MPARTAPNIDPTAWVAPNATVRGRVTIGADASVWFGVVIRAEHDEITIGAGTNIQDNSVLHCDPGMPCIIGADVTVGHRAVLHGCTVGDGALIGIGAIVLNRAVVGAGALIAAGAVVTEGSEIPSGWLAIGAPARPVRELTDVHTRRVAMNAPVYRDLAAAYRRGDWPVPSEPSP